MILARRSFLKGMAGLVGIAAVGAIPGASQVDESIWLDAISDSVLDMPVTVAEPLAWLEFDGRKIAITDGYPTVKTEFAEYHHMNLLHVTRVPSQRYWGIDCRLEDYIDCKSTHDALYDAFFCGKAKSVRILPPFGGKVFSGDAYFKSLSRRVTAEDSMILELSLQGVGPLLAT